MSAERMPFTVGVIGAGTMGSGIAQVAASAGHPVFLVDSAAEAVTRALRAIEADLGRSVAKGRTTEGERAATLARIVPCADLGRLASAELAIEAIVEQLDAKQQLFATLEGILKPDAILATNTSSISVTAIAAKLAHPERCVGMHFFNPAPLMQLVEVVRGLASDPAVVARVVGIATAWDKRPVVAKSTPGFVVNRIARPFYAEALRLLHEGAADVATIDTAMREAGGFRMGPFQLMDLIGNDVNYAVTSSVFEAMYGDPRFAPSLVQKELVDAGRFGRKSGRGFYDYAAGAAPLEPATASAASAPSRVAACAHADPALVAAAAGVCAVAERACEGECGFEIDETLVFACDGLLATQRARASGRAVVTYDLARDYAATPRIVLAASLQSTAQQLQAAAGFFQALGKQVSFINDVPGMIVMRTVCMLANEASDAVNQGVCSAQGADEAMVAGVNYPEGPLGWADRIGADRVLRALENMSATYGEDRYRASPYLRRMALAGRPLRGAS